MSPTRSAPWCSLALESLVFAFPTQADDLCLLGLRDRRPGFIAQELGSAERSHCLLASKAKRPGPACDWKRLQHTYETNDREPRFFSRRKNQGDQGGVCVRVWDIHAY
ncbi:hypothetical protein F4821DRAFT_65995 [Hypoxylon rubiginosum]|uniref:Uncharacterized protein n=1 Tax=Hypoxylon rubiginosum TaxID=110542 RepID=A0ACC0D929_9PEZI|nr:hypothetical protein F4821DRAFT_65995 [Hypoxylon rubiginosum]